MDLDCWIDGCKVTAFPWIDGKYIYFNVQYFIHGSSISQSPKWEQTVYITGDEKGRRLVYEFTNTLTRYVERNRFPKGKKVVITAESIPVI
jgi:hypothetical protein